MSKNQGKKQKENLPAKKPSAELQDNSTLSFKGNEEADAGDIIVPRMLLMQGTSKWVPEEFQQGDLINSVEETLLAKRGDIVEIIPFILKKTWQVFTREKTPVWVREEVWNADNDDLDWEFEEEDPDRGTVELKRQRNYGFYAFIVAKEVDPFPVPVLVNFRSSAGFRDGKKIASHFSMMKGMNAPGFNVIWRVSSETVKNDDQAFQKFVIKKSRMATAIELEPVYHWLKLMEKGAHKIKDHEVAEAEEVTAPIATPSVKKGEVSQQAQF